MATTIKRDPEFDARVERIARARLNAAVQLVRNRVVVLINRTQPTRTTASGRKIGLSPSLPGEPPKRLTGALVRSIVAGVAKDGQTLRGFVGTNRQGARRLEFGFSGADARGRVINQAPRPFLRRGLMESRDAVRRALIGEA